MAGRWCNPRSKKSWMLANEPVHLTVRLNLKALRAEWGRKRIPPDTAGYRRMPPDTAGHRGALPRSPKWVEHELSPEHPLAGEQECRR